MTRPLPVSAVLEFVGDPVVLVYAARYVLASRGSDAHVAVCQALIANAEQLPTSARRALARDIGARFDVLDDLVPAAELRAWQQARARLAVPRARPTVSRTDLNSTRRNR